MKKRTKVLGTSLSALVLTGLTANKVLNTDITTEKLSDTLVDFAFNSKQPTEAKAAWTNPNGDFVYSGTEFIVAKEEKALSAYAKQLGVTEDKLRDLNDVSDGKRITSQWGTVYQGSLLYYKLPNSNKKYYYNKSQSAPVNITTSNWKNKESLYLSTKYNYNMWSSAKRLNYSLYENQIELTSDKKLLLKGWSAQTNYTDTTGSNNQTAIIATNEGTKNQVQLVTAKNTNINPSKQFIYNQNNPGNESIQCPATDTYLDRSTSFNDKINGSGYSAKNMSGCWHNYRNAGFEAKLDLDQLFGGNNYNKVYDLYIAQSTGNNPNRVLHKKLSSRSQFSRTYTDVGGKYSGTIFFEGKNTQIQENKTTVQVDDDNLNMYRGLDSTQVYVVNGTNNFKTGRYIIEDMDINTKSQTMYYKLKGYGATAGYHGWTSSSFIDDASDSAQLRFRIDNWEKFNVNYLSGDKEDRGTVIKKADTHTVYAKENASLNQYSTKKISKDDESIIKADNGIIWRLLPTSIEPTNRDYTVKFDANKPLSDINYYYTKSQEVNIHYINANTGKEIKTVKDEIAFNKSKTYTFKDLDSNNASNSNLVTYNGVTYKYAGDGSYNGQSANIKDYSSEFNKVGLDKDPFKKDLNTYGNKYSQTRTYNESNVDGIDDVYFYYYEPQAYAVNHVRIDSKENLVDSTGKVTTNLGTATVLRESSVHYTGDKIDIGAYGIKGNTGKETYPQSFGRYKFSGKGKYENSPKIYNAKTITSKKEEQIATGKTDVDVSLVKLKDTEYGAFGNLYYRKAIADPSGECDITVEKCDTPTQPTDPTEPEEPGNPNVPNVDDPKLDYTASMTGQYNWYLTKDKNTTSDTWKESKLALTNNGNLGNEKVFAVNNFVNTINVNDGKQATYQSSYKGQTNDIYYSDLIDRRTVVTTVGEGIAQSKQTMSVSKTRENLKTVENAKTLYTYRKYDVLNKAVYLNSKLYQEQNIKTQLDKQLADGNITSSASNVSTHYDATASKDAVKNKKVDYDSEYNYTNRLKDNYKVGENYNGFVFTWDYDYTNPVFNNTKYETRVTSTIDHKLKEDIKDTEVVSTQNAKITSKVGILRDFNKFKSTLGKNGGELMESRDSNSTVLNETVTKTVASTGKLDTQSKLTAQEEIKYTNDIWNGKLSDKGIATETFVGFRDYSNEFTYNKVNGYNKYLTPDTDFNFREKTVANVTSPDLSKVETAKYTATALQTGFNFQNGTVATNKTVQVTSGKKVNQDVNINFANKYGVLTDSGVLLEGTSYANIESNIDAKYSTATGHSRSIYKQASTINKDRSDSLITPSTDTYYLPTDAESTMVKGQNYTNRQLLSNVGLSDRNIAIDNKYSFDNYLIGTQSDNTMISSYKGSLSKTGTYTSNKVIVTSKEKDLIKSESTASADDSKNFRTLNAKDVNIVLSPYTGLTNLGQ